MSSVSAPDIYLPHLAHLGSAAGTELAILEVASQTLFIPALAYVSMCTIPCQLWPSASFSF